MKIDSESGSRRDFITDVGRLASVITLTACMPPSASAAHSAGAAAGAATGTAWDLGWMRTLQRASDRAVFDWPGLGDPADPIVLEIAERYLDNCAAAYGSLPYEARVVLNIRTQAVGAALGDKVWERYSLGVEYNVKDPTTQQPATRNPFWHRAPSPAPGIVMPTLADLVERGAIVLVCDFALGHLSKRLATKMGIASEAVHEELRDGFVTGAFAVPSGIFGLARAQNSGCAFVRM
ncbi:MAG: hypothetical protein ABIT20_07725 [Gemmatimonadaceae bacterium]